MLAGEARLRIQGFIWLRGIVDKLGRKHKVSQDEVEEIFCNRPQYDFVEAGQFKGEDVYSALGRTYSGRYLIVFFIRKVDNRALILSARDMDSKERRRYGRK